jgi:putative ABC transport system permease protein
MSHVLQDLRFAGRLLLKQPAFTLLTIFVLAVGIGANTAIFSVVDAVLLRQLPYADADRLVSVSSLFLKTGRRFPVSAPDFHDWHDQSTSFAGMASYLRHETSVTVDGAGGYTSVTRATDEFFPLMGGRAELGRLPTTRELHAGGGGTWVAVVSHGFWITRLGGTPDAIGRTLKYSDQTFTVIGVLPPAFRFPDNTDVWVPWTVTEETVSRSASNYRVVGRLKPGVSLAQAQAEMDGIARRLELAYPLANDGKGAAVDRLLDQQVRNIRATLNLIFAVVVTVMLIACANVSNLLLARAATRTREVGIRVAVGASRARLIGQLLTESTLLAAAGGLAGVLLAGWCIRGLLAIAPAGLPRLDEVHVDLRVLAFAACVSLGATLVFGLGPAWQGSQVDVADVLKQGGRAGSSRGSRRLRAALIVFETAAAVVLVIGAGLLIRSFAALSQVDLGFQTDHVLVIDTTVPAGDENGWRRAVRFYHDLLPRLSAIPGVQSAAAVMGVPTRARSDGGYAIEGGPSFAEMGVRSPHAFFTVTTPNYFHTIGIPVREGRDLADSDEEHAPLVAVVNEAFVRQSFPSTSPLGHRVQTGLDPVHGTDGTGYMTIVGVVADVRNIDPALPAQPQIYMPYQQHLAYATALSIVLRTSGEPRRAAQAAEQAVRALNPDVPSRVSTLEDTLGAAVSTPRFRTVLLGLFASVALLLAMAGIYGVVSFTVAQRTSEMGLRMALGAQRSEIVRLTLFAGLKLTALGVGIGWIAAWWLSRLLETMLFATVTHDPVIFGLVPLLLFLVAAIASAMPAVRAARVDPVIALRAE